MKKLSFPMLVFLSIAAACAFRGSIVNGEFVIFPFGTFSFDEAKIAIDVNPDLLPATLTIEKEDGTEETYQIEGPEDVPNPDADSATLSPGVEPLLSPGPLPKGMGSGKKIYDFFFWSMDPKIESSHVPIAGRVHVNARNREEAKRLADEAFGATGPEQIPGDVKVDYLVIRNGRPLGVRGKGWLLPLRVLDDDRRDAQSIAFTLNGQPIPLPPVIRTESPFGVTIDMQVPLGETLDLPLDFGLTILNADASLPLKLSVY